MVIENAFAAWENELTAAAIATDIAKANNGLLIVVIPNEEVSQFL
jgi:hypothetical protein